jgi:hypothetical protein
LPTYRKISARLGKANALRGLGEALMPADAEATD